MLVFFSLLCASLALKNEPPKKVHSLPGWSGFFPSIWTGYITVNETYGRHIFYWLVEATEVNPEKAPVCLWMQGGPGGSGEIGMWWENLGGTHLTSDTTARFERTGAWAKWCNMIFIDQPAGVSFSYSDNSADYALNSDTRSAHDNYVFLQEWFRVNSRYQGEQLWIAGESYGGVYVPMLAHALVTKDANGLGQKLQGVMIGNPVMRCEFDEIGTTFQAVSTFYFHGMVSFEDMEAFWNAGCTDKAARNGFESTECKAIMAKILSNDYLGHDFDPDNRFMDACTSNGSLAYADSLPTGCSPYGSRMRQYLSRADVIAAIHAKKPVSKPNWNYTMDVKSMDPFYQAIIDSKKKVLIYSGDVDIGTLPPTYTYRCLYRIKARGARARAWTPWTLNGHTAGYTEAFTGLTYATVRGAGHETMAFSPLLTDAMFERFTKHGSLLPGGEKKAKITAKLAVDAADPFFSFSRQSALLRHFSGKN